MQVLVANDARLLAELRATALGRAGIELHVARPEPDVAEQAAMLRPAAVLLADGEACPDPVGLCHRLRARPETCTTPVIVLGLAFHRFRLESAGADAFVARPLRRAELHDSLRRILGIEPRAAVRRRVELPARVIGRAGGSDAAPRAAIVHDLSLTGAFLAGESLPEPGAALHVRFELLGRRLELPARVVRRGNERFGPVGAAVAFEGLDTATRILLAAVARQGLERTDAVRGGAGR